MINDKKFDFSEESNIKDALLKKLRLKFICEKQGKADIGELSDEDLEMAAGGLKANCPFGESCDTCPKNKNGECKLK